ncbi:uncharacterized protein DUF1292 [Caldicellulosiruptor bescii]|uniref:UPF0473 protein Athe_1150 n=2 Tax=Caldicellulosiruptor bescii TaxID=31899 RepID=Y1150_CALBD|nr:DUF1292 domain-containing protein [Caldicellulosiruptor bescii]B9MRE7.1 RecName: Full=UPF0473 protein Athe_1150 [Caldicellulosiruptor bescii DSM 6725]ACM60251.1 protein of unknown function DUF1292 [Caldicellulosiruptor bescii DSM 6725]PBC87666.1 uncharacterized protein DUF1292 [Caldicellulosiruptor bescii]PBC90599.1 uncharacterized protein DUF1292 [Caldicellulosiruptor bescii]PBD03969.1 uncharacterized protein DUF1292 [Caldicellulosiruptor bescii]PBD06396.1 uncharacterized protein DUF1292 
MDMFADNVVTLVDEEGREISFEMLDRVNYNGNDYIVLLPLEEMEKEDEEAEVVILRIEDRDGEEVYVGVEDEEELENVFEIFQSRFDDEDFDMYDDDEE